MRSRLYADRSALWGYESDKLAPHSVTLVDRFIRGDGVLVLSNLTIQELATAPAAARVRLALVPEAYIEMQQFEAEASELAEAYIAEGLFNPKIQAEPRHVAIATVARVDALVSWNFTGLIDLQRLHGYAHVNTLRGYKMIEVRTPQSV